MLENIRLSFQGVWSHKMRSFLTMLGIIIGIASIIAIVSTIKGTNEQIKQNLVGSGNNTIEIKLMQNNSEYYAYDDNIPSSKVPVLNEELREELLAMDEIEDATFYLRRTYAENSYYNTTSLDYQYYGIDEHYFNTCGYTTTEGRMFVSDDYTKFRKVAILDKDVASSLFAGEDPLGKTLEIAGEPFTVVGIVEKSTKFRPVINSEEDYKRYMSNQESKIYIPNSVWPIIFCFDEIPNAIIKAVNTDAMSDAGNKAADAINSFIGVSNIPDGLLANSGSGADGGDMGTADAEAGAMDAAAGGSSDQSNSYKYKATDIMETAKNLQELSAATNQQLIWIASISLLVGGIGVMNIMLVSVTERTQEIGLKKAIGARKNRILAQFLTEAAVLTSLGGILGIVAGIVLAEVISKISATPVAISIPAIIFAVVFSVVIGIIFGLLPSVKAANLNPIDALRHE